MTFFTKFFSSLRHTFQSMDEKGVVAVEFVFIFPIIVTMYFGLESISAAMMANRKVNLASRTISDLVSQQPSATALSDATLDQIKAAAAAIVYPMDASKLKILISEVIIYNENAQLKARTEFSINMGGQSLRGCGQLSQSSNGSGFNLGAFPAGLYTQGSYIEAHVEYPWTFGSLGNITLSAENYMRPRQNSYISYSGGKPSTKCTGLY